MAYIILFYFGGAMNQLLGCLNCRTHTRIGLYGVIFMCVYWLPLGIEFALDPGPPKK
jgi:hypothetical protein